ncbi:RsbR, positive regulator of sigma-B [Rubrivivax gelatinosus]|nr:RsbR, positive regulator of sigma-B [Rubrivivax gelatinosus]
MTASLAPLLLTLLRSRSDSIRARWQARLTASGGNYLRGLTPQTELSAEMQALLDGLAQVLASGSESFDSDPSHPLSAALRSASQVRVARGFTPEESITFVLTCKESLIEELHEDAALRDTGLAATLHVERLLDRCVLVLASSFVAAREDIIRRQSESLREVSTPVITLWDSILLLPLVGVVDSVRAQQISERLLEAIAASESEVTLIDVTGVPVMDTSVARHILKTVAAAEMLGTKVILTGISPSTAQTMVKLGIDMSGVPTRGSLKAGMALALQLTGRRIAAA